MNPPKWTAQMCIRDRSYPTTFMFTKEGKVFGYLSGQLSEDIMRNIIAQTISGKRETNGN